MISIEVEWAYEISDLRIESKVLQLDNSLVLETIRLAVQKNAAELWLHSNQGS